MKKLFLGLSAIAMLFATSCQNEMDFGASAGETATVAFKVETPEIQTRSYSDGTTATVLQYAVYDAAGNELSDFTVTNGEIHGSTSVNLQLTTGNTYSVIFWAAAPNAPYSVDFAAKQMTVDYTNAVSNDENRDAFYKHHTFTVKGAQTETIELRRPFAQLNVGTNDLAESKKAGYAPEFSYVKVPVSSVLNLVDGTVNEAAAVEFKLAAIPTNEEFPVAGYDYLSMNYLLVAADKHLVDVTFGYSENDTEVEKSRVVGSVPVQRNHRTNLYGQLLTGDVTINVEIKPEYDEPAYEAEDFFHAAAFGGEVTLTEDIVLTTPLNIQANMTINLNGNKITGALNVAEGVQVTVSDGVIVNNDKAVSAIVSNGELTLNNVEITSARHAVRIESGSAIINGGVYKVAPISKSTLHALNIGDDNTVAEVSIFGGTFIGPKGTIADSGAAVNVRAGSSLTIDGGNFSGGKKNTISSNGTVEICGGNFDQKPSDNYVADGFKAVENNGKWYVVGEEMDAVVSSTSEFTAALASGNNLYLAAGEYKMPAGNNFSSDDIIVCDAGTVFTGNSKLNINGATIVGATFSNPSGSAVDQTINGTFVGCTFEGSNALRWCYTGETAVFESCVFDGSVYGIHFDGGSKELIFRNCVISGFNGLASSIGMVTFEGCTFVGNGKSGYNGANLWGSAKMIDCEFTFDGSTANEWIDCIGAGKTYEFTNCTINGEAYTPANYTLFGQIFSRNHVAVKINGEECAM